jgi:hypothetical protein
MHLMVLMPRRPALQTPDISEEDESVMRRPI